MTEFCYAHIHSDKVLRIFYSHATTCTFERSMSLEGLLKTLGDDGWSLRGVAGSEFGYSYTLFFERLSPSQSEGRPK